MNVRACDRRDLVDGWLWWATFRAGAARGFGITGAGTIADAARAELWLKGPR